MDRFPAPVDERRMRRSYPPLQWRPLRVVNPWQKAGFLVGLFALGWPAMAAADLVLPSMTVVIGWQVVSSVVLVALARSFRGIQEPIAPPRAWWRLTAYPLAGWWLGALNFLGFFGLAMDGWDPLRIPAAVVGLLFAIAFFNSSARLTARRART